MSREYITFASELINITINSKRNENSIFEYYKHYHSTSTTVCGRK